MRAPISRSIGTLALALTTACGAPAAESPIDGQVQAGADAPAGSGTADAAATPTPDATAGCYDEAPDGVAHLVAEYTVSSTSLAIVNPFLTAGDLAADLANGGMTITAPGIGSGLTYAGGCPGSFWFATDRGPNGAHETDANGLYFPLPAFTPTLVRADIDTGALAIAAVLPLVTLHDVPITGLPNGPNDQTAYPDATSDTPLAANPDGLDLEDARPLPSGDFLVAEEYAPSVALVDGATGAVRVRYTPVGVAPAADSDVRPILPAIFSQRRPNHGFEGLALSADGRTAYAVLQSAMGDETDSRYRASRIHRVIRLDVSVPDDALVTGDFLIEAPNNNTFGPDIPQRDVLCSAATWLAPDRLLLLIRAPGETRLVSYALTPSANVLGAADEGALLYEDVDTDLGALGIAPTSGIAVFSTLDLPAAGFDDKLEGLDILSDDVLALTNDNDFGITDPAATTHLWIVRTAANFR